MSTATKESVQKNMHKLNSFAIKKAKFLLKLKTESRLKMYRKLASLLRNRFSLMDSLERLYEIASKNGKETSNTETIAILAWMHAVQNGETFSQAVKGWAPTTEILMLSVGDIANLELALDNAIRVVEGMRNMKAPLVEAISYPLFLICTVILLIWCVGRFMVPPMVDAVDGIMWRGTARSLVDLSEFVDHHPLILFLTLPVIFAIISITLPIWKGPSRTFFDKMPPWSIYRIFIGVGWLLSLSALVESGTPVSKALRMLRKDASPYLLYRIDKALIFINNGDNLGESLYKTNLNFPDEELIGDLRVYSELDNFPEALSSLSNEWMGTAVKTIEQKAGILNTVAILLIASVIAWVVFGTFEMQNQMTSRMGIA